MFVTKQEDMMPDYGWRDEDRDWRRSNDRYSNDRSSNDRYSSGRYGRDDDWSRDDRRGYSARDRDYQMSQGSSYARPMEPGQTRYENRGYGRDYGPYDQGRYGYNQGQGYGSDRGYRDRDDFDYRGDRNYRGGYGGAYRGERGEYGRRDRDWMDRAGDEVASWMGDDDAEYRREMDRRRDAQRGSYRDDDDYRRGGYGSRRWRDDW